MSLAVLGIRNSFRKPLRTGLSVVGVALCIVLVLTVSSVSGRYTSVVEQSYSIYKSDLLVVSNTAILIGGIPVGGAIPYSTVSQIGGVAGVASATPILLIVNVQQLIPSNITIGIPIQNFSMFGMATTVQLRGSYPTGPDQAVVGQYLASSTGITLGSTLKEGSTSLVVTGILDTPNIVLSNALIMPLQTAQAIQGYAGLVTAVLVNTVGQSAPTADRINSEVAGVVAMQSARGQSFVEPLISLVGTFDFVLGAIAIILALLFVAVIVSVNILDQRDELSTMVAVGAPSGSVHAVALCETLFVSAAGVLAGVLLSVLATAFVFQKYASIPLSVSFANLSVLLPRTSTIVACGGVVACGVLVGALVTSRIVRDVG